MHPLVERSMEPEPGSAIAFTVLSSLTTHGRDVDQFQYVSEQYVVTEVGGSTILFAPGLGGRFVVDRARRQLHRFDMAGQRPAPEQVRSLLGELRIESDDGPFEVEGFVCRLLRISNRDARLLVSVDTYCARVNGLELTAIDAERRFDAPHQPFSIPVRPDEIIVRSTTRALAADFEQSQTLQLRSIRPIVEQSAVLDEMLRYPIVAE